MRFMNHLMGLLFLTGWLSADALAAGKLIKMHNVSGGCPENSNCIELAYRALYEGETLVIGCIDAGKRDGISFGNGLSSLIETKALIIVKPGETRKIEVPFTNDGRPIYVECNKYSGRNEVDDDEGGRSGWNDAQLNRMLSDGIP